MKRLLFFAAFTALTTMPMMAMGADAELRASLFADVDQLLGTAREMQSELLAPRSFGKALDAYRDAQERFERGQSIARIK